MSPRTVDQHGMPLPSKWELCPFQRMLEKPRERQAVGEVCLGLTAGAHRYQHLDQLIAILVRSKIALIGGAPRHAEALEAWAARHLEDALGQVPEGWRPAA